MANYTCVHCGTINVIERKKRAAKVPFAAPTREEVQSYFGLWAQEHGMYISQVNSRTQSEMFCDHHGNRSWKLKNGALMADWRLAANTWARNNFDKVFIPIVAPTTTRTPMRPAL